MTTAERQCPLCDAPTSALHCPAHGVPTVDVGFFRLPPEDVKSGDLVAGRYRIDRVLGKGGMGTVFVATQLGMNRTVAVKILRRDRLSELRHLRRFYQEAQAVSRLKHPNIVQVFDFGVDDRTRAPFLVMEFGEGRTLEDLIAAEGPLKEKRAAFIFAQIAKALVEAHENGIVHRDLKPPNVLIGRLRDGDEHVKVLDFGVAKILRVEGPGWENLTAPGMTVGSPRYMSPEQAKGLEVGPRSDLYSLGCLLHLVLAGRPPFDSDRLAEVLTFQVTRPPPPLPAVLPSGDVPTRAMRELRDALLAKDPEDRPETAAGVARVLGQLSRGEPADVQAVLAKPRRSLSPDAVLAARSSPAMLGFEHATVDDPRRLPPPVGNHDESPTIPTALPAVVVSSPKLQAVNKDERRTDVDRAQLLLAETKPARSSIALSSPAAEAQGTPITPMQSMPGEAEEVSLGSLKSIQALQPFGDTEPVPPPGGGSAATAPARPAQAFSTGVVKPIAAATTSPGVARQRTLSTPVLEGEIASRPPKRTESSAKLWIIAASLAVVAAGAGGLWWRAQVAAERERRARSAEHAAPIQAAPPVATSSGAREVKLVKPVADPIVEGITPPAEMRPVAEPPAAAPAAPMGKKLEKPRKSFPRPNEKPKSKIPIW